MTQVIDPTEGGYAGPAAQTFEVAQAPVTPAPLLAITALVQEIFELPPSQWMEAWIALGTIVERAAERRVKAGEG